MIREFAAGGLVYKKDNGICLWLITKSSPSKEYPREFWRLPKGWIDDGPDGKIPGPLTSGERKAKDEEISEAALREVREEAGVEAEIIKKIGTERYFFVYLGKKILKFVTFYLMQYVGNLKEGHGFETSEVSWLNYEEARKKLSHPLEKKVLDKAKKILDEGAQDNLV